MWDHFLNMEVICLGRRCVLSFSFTMGKKSGSQKRKEKRDREIKSHVKKCKRLDSFCKWNAIVMLAQFIALSFHCKEDGGECCPRTQCLNFWKIKPTIPWLRLDIFISGVQSKRCFINTLYMLHIKCNKCTETALSTFFVQLMLLVIVDFLLSFQFIVRFCNCLF